MAKSKHYTIKLVMLFCFICLPTCNGMSVPEAVFKCKSSITKAEDTYSKLSNADLKILAKAALSMMKDILEELSHGGTLKEIPAKTQLCIQHADHVAWLKDSIEPALQPAKSETKTASKKNDPEPQVTKAEPSEKKPKKKSKKVGKKLELNQRDPDLKSLEKVLKKENDSNSIDDTKSPKASGPAL